MQGPEDTAPCILITPPSARPASGSEQSRLSTINASNVIELVNCADDCKQLAARFAIFTYEDILHTSFAFNWRKKGPGVSRWRPRSARQPRGGHLGQNTPAKPDNLIVTRASTTYFEGTAKSVAACDEETRLTTSVYIDLNPVATQVAKAPETSAHTLIRRRPNHIEAHGATARLEAAKDGNVARSGHRRRPGRFSVALSDRRPPWLGFDPQRHVVRLLAGELRPARRLQRGTLSPRQGFDLGGAGRDPRATQL